MGFFFNKGYQPEEIEFLPVDNAGEQHLPCVILADTSGSMKYAMEELKEGLEILGETLCEDDTARGRVEVCIISFDDTARVETPFGPVSEYYVPELTCGGRTAMHAAVDLALSKIEERKQEYRRIGTPYYRPWIFMLTDGAPNDEDHGEFSRLLEAQRARHCTFFPVGIGNGVNYELLKSLKLEGYALKAEKDSFKGAFEWLSNSLASVSMSRPGEGVPLQDPGEKNIYVVS